MRKTIRSFTLKDDLLTVKKMFAPDKIYNYQEIGYTYYHGHISRGIFRDKFKMSYKGKVEIDIILDTQGWSKKELEKLFPDGIAQFPIKQD